jgi:uncharacterized membrane protein YfhO
VFTIPYDEGWSIWADGEKRETSQAVNGLLAVTGLDPGEHELELKYIPTGFRLGMPVSLICLLVLGVLVYKKARTSSI